MSETFLARCRAFAVCTWSDALDELGTAGVVGGIPKRVGAGRFAGHAVTVKQATGPLGTFVKSDFAVGRMVDSLKSGDVLVVDMGGAPISTMGGNAAMAACRNGAVAAIIDGACRDIDEIEQSGLWVASRHVSPTTGKTRVRVESIGEPVIVGGVAVHAGDLVIGDDTGTIVVPASQVDRALTVIERVQKIDLMLNEGLKKGLSFAEAARAAKYL